MSHPKGKRILALLAEYAPARWFTRELPALALKVQEAMQARNEVQHGGILSIGASVTASVLQISTTLLESVLNGRLKADLAAITNTTLFVTGGSIARPTFGNGATAVGITLATNETAYITVIACNTDGAGGAVDTDNGAVKLVALVNGTSSTYMNKTAYMTSTEIQAALDAAAGVHEGVTGWVHLGNILWNENGGAPTATATLNRNNVITGQ